MSKVERYAKNPKKADLYKKLKILFNRLVNGASDDWNYPIVGHLSSQSLIKLLAINSHYKKILKTPGHIVEFGSFFGTNILLFQNLKYIHEPHVDRQIFSFDRFRENQIYDVKNASKKFKYHTYDSAFSDLLATSEIHHALNSIPFKDSFVHLIDGDIEKTLPEILLNDSDFSICLVYIDVDSNSLSKFIFEKISNRLVSGGIVIIEGYLNKNTMGIASEIRDFISVFKEVGPLCRLGMSNYLVSFEIL